MNPNSSGKATPAPGTDTVVDTDEKSALADCQTLLNDAQSACATKDDDDSSSIADSLTGACKDLQTAGMTNGNSKNQQAKACQSAWQSCVQSCGTSADKYTDNDDWSTFNGNSRVCGLLQSKSKALLDASSSSQKAATGGMNCLSTASENSNTKKDDKTAADANVQAAACTSNPSGPGCGSTAPQYAAAEKGQGQFGTIASQGGSTDVADTSGVTAQGYAGSGGDSGQNVPKVNPIANNTGGGIPGGGGGNAGGGGGGNSGGGVMGMVSSAITDIQKGFLGGGPSTPAPAPTEESNPPPPNAEGTEPGSTNDRSPASLKGAANLRRYLPGGDLWKGLTGPAQSPVFHGPEVNLWSRVHERIIERCKLGVLYDCQLPK